jgi:mono/diheme cytochrome c family protein
VLGSVVLRFFSGALIVSLLACTAPTSPPIATTVALASPTSVTIPPTAVPATVVPPTDTGLSASSTPIATGAPATPTVAAAQPTPVPATATPAPTTAPATATVAIARPTPVPPTATPIPATAGPLTASQIASTAIANAAGEECVASPPQPAKGFVGNPIHGKALYADRGCSACHGDLAQRNIGPKLAGTSLSISAVIQQLRSPRGVMQRYLPADQSDADECDVYTYVRSLK